MKIFSGCNFISSWPSSTEATNLFDENNVDAQLLIGKMHHCIKPEGRNRNSVVKNRVYNECK